ncbi:MAG: NADH:ubiquinone oxidoreductase subunit NDUFA12 [Alphaproteobacteria bacterium]
MTIGTRLFTLWKGRLVGTDEFGNRYYRERGHRRGSAPRRWVLYGAAEEASLVPPDWHAWLHYTADQPPDKDAPRRPWQKDHLPNRTGTTEAYRPPGHDYAGGRRDGATGDYQPWRPS